MTADGVQWNGGGNRAFQSTLLICRKADRTQSRLKRHASLTKEDIDAFKLKSGDDTVPALSVGKTWLKGFEAGQWNSELDIAGYSKTAPYRPQAPPTAAPNKSVEK